MYTVEVETTKLVIDSITQSPDLARLRLLKARTNLNDLKSKGIDRERILEAEDQLLTAEFNIEKAAETQIKNQNLEILKDEDELNMMGSELRQRNNSKDDENMIAIQQLQQHQLSTDLLEMTAKIKENAKKFQMKLDTDKDLVDQTGDALQRTSGVMSKVGNQLQKYRKETIGWRFYLASALFIFIIAFFGMFLIQLFGKW